MNRDNQNFEEFHIEFLFKHQERFELESEWVRYDDTIYGEEDLALEIFEKMKKRYPDLKFRMIKKTTIVTRTIHKE